MNRNTSSILAVLSTLSQVALAATDVSHIGRFEVHNTWHNGSWVEGMYEEGEGTIELNANPHVKLLTFIDKNDEEVRTLQLTPGDIVEFTRSYGHFKIYKRFDSKIAEERENCIFVVNDKEKALELYEMLLEVVRFEVADVVYKHYMYSGGSKKLEVTHGDLSWRTKGEAAIFLKVEGRTNPIRMPLGNETKVKLSDYGEYAEFSFQQSNRNQLCQSLQFKINGLDLCDPSTGIANLHELCVAHGELEIDSDPPVPEESKCQDNDELSHAKFDVAHVEVLISQDGLEIHGKADETQMSIDFSDCTTRPIHVLTLENEFVLDLSDSDMMETELLYYSDGEDSAVQFHVRLWNREENKVWSIKFCMESDEADFLVKIFETTTGIIAFDKRSPISKEFNLQVRQIQSRVPVHTIQIRPVEEQDCYEFADKGSHQKIKPIDTQATDI